MSGDGLTVTGGSTGIEAWTDDLRTAGRLMRAAALGIDASLRSCAGPMRGADPGFAGPGFEAYLHARAVLGAAAALSSDLDHFARALAASAQLYDDADEDIAARIWDGFTGLLDTVAHLYLAPSTFAVAWYATGDAETAAWAVLDDNLTAVDTALNGALTTVPGLATMLGLQSTPDGRPVVRATGHDSGGAAASPPRGLGDLMCELDRRDHGPHGAVDVRLLTGPDGTRRAVVDITGTKDFFGAGGTEITDLTTNTRALVGRDCSYEQGIFEALQQAGVRPGEAIMLVGHSQGGMVAVNAARDAAAHGFTVTHVLTAGSPIGLTAAAVPSGIQVLALENRRDIVPHLDGRENPDRRNVTTATFEAPVGSAGEEHDIAANYVRGAQLVDASDDPALRAFLDSASGFLTATTVDTLTFSVSRAP